eukprot:Ihof_evm19s27 gene=Ihof_evmTU19s27
MVRKKIDNRIRTLVENGVKQHHRTFFVLVGDRGRDQVVNLHYMLSKAVVKARPSVLWCYKKELGFSSNRKKRMRQIKTKMARGLMDPDQEDPFELFVSSTNIRYTYYADSHKILGNTYGMLVLQDFEAVTPNLLARTIETVEGGGIVVLLLRTMKSLRQLYTMSMDVHNRFRTEAHQDVVGRFNERFILSLGACKNCLVLDDELSVLPLSAHGLNIQPLPAVSEDVDTPEKRELRDLQVSLKETQPVGTLVEQAKTLDQAKALLTFVEAISDKTLRSTVTLTAARGRGKSAALGLAISAAVAYGYSNIFITSPSPENLKTTFEFVFKGFDALEYEEHLDYDLVQSANPAFNNAIVRVNIFRQHRQTIQYIQPQDAHKLGQAELVVIDEAAAIPLPLVRALMGNYLVFMASTINGYEGTGRSLSLKLIKQLRTQSVSSAATQSDGATAQATTATTGGRILREVQLEEPIRYSAGDPIERWLNDLLCLDAQVSDSAGKGGGCPHPKKCELYYVNRDTLFSFHRASELFLQRLMALYVSSHYKNSPNDLQMLSDAPAHHLFCLLGPIDPTKPSLPEVLCVVQVCLEGEISKETVAASLARGKSSSGDLIPWTVSQQFQDNDFASLSGARIVRIATHPAYQKMGYGSRALELLQDYYQGRVSSLAEEDSIKTGMGSKASGDNDIYNENISARKDLPPLLSKLSERPAERLHWLGVAYGLTEPLLKFWRRTGMAPVYLRQTENELTGEHSCIMLQALDASDLATSVPEGWVDTYVQDFRKRFVNLLGFQFRTFNPSLALSLLEEPGKKIGHIEPGKELSKTEMESILTSYDQRRLKSYSNNLLDYHAVTDLLPPLARVYFTGKLPVNLSALMSAVMLGMGLQYKTIDDLEKECGLPANQLLAMFNRAMRKLVQYIQGVAEGAVEAGMVKVKEIEMEPEAMTVDEELDEAAKEANAELRKKQQDLISSLDLD